MQFGSLQITPRVCYSRPPTEAPRTDSFAEVDEVETDKTLRRIFSWLDVRRQPRPAWRRASRLRHLADRLQRRRTAGEGGARGRRGACRRSPIPPPPTSPRRPAPTPTPKPTKTKRPKPKPTTAGGDSCRRPTSGSARPRVSSSPTTPRRARRCVSGVEEADDDLLGLDPRRPRAVQGPLSARRARERDPRRSGAQLRDRSRGLSSRLRRGRAALRSRPAAS